jgi:8-oxo-dGTP pyrophosphatase MutT (NUDIX family)
MDFNSFLEYIPQIKLAKLPAQEAHTKMEPSERMNFIKMAQSQNKIPKVAGVLMLLYPKNGITHLALIVRNTYEGVHSAQIAFPGGKFETDDVTFDKTALRETHEEIGVLPEKVQIVKAFTPTYIPPSNFMVHPFLGVSKIELNFVPDPNEVSEIIELPISELLSDKIVTETKLSTSYMKEIVVPAFVIQKHIVWGATAMMLSELKEVLKRVSGF